MYVKFTDNSDIVLEELEEAGFRALERCGLKGEGYAKDLVPVDTGNLKNSISHKVIKSEKAAYVGTNSEYGGFVELGTGQHATTGGGTPKERWAYIGDDGKWHMGYPAEPRPYIKPAVADHAQTYRNIIKDELKGR